MVCIFKNRKSIIGLGLLAATALTISGASGAIKSGAPPQEAAIPLGVTVQVQQAASGQSSEPGGAVSAVPYYPSKAGEPGPLLWMADVPLGGTNEPAVAVNPRNPLNVAHASLFSLRVSNDGGAIFLPPVAAVVPASHVLCGDPSLAFDSQGRLFWTYLGCIPGGIDIFIAQVNPATGAILAGYPVNVTASPGVNLPGALGFVHDKEWLAADCFPDSPFADNLYVVWTEFAAATRVLSTVSTNQGMTWSAVFQHSAAGEGFVWPTHNTVAPNGDVYVAYHSQPGFLAGAPDGVSGQVFVRRSTGGGLTFPAKNLAYLPGQADMTFNVQTSGATIPGTQFWLQGSVQPWIMADPNVPGRIYVVANDDPDNNNTAGDAADVFIAISTNFGVVFGTPARIDGGPGLTFQVMPTAGIDKKTGCIVVHYYDNRIGATNPAGNFLLDVFATSSTDGGLTFSLDSRINDLAFDPDPGAPVRFAGPPPTTRIGEYNGVAVGGPGGCLANAVWCGNILDPAGIPIGQQSIFDTDRFQLVWFANKADFAEAAQAAGKFRKGREDYEASIQAPASVDGFDDALHFGVPNLPDAFPYPAGTDGLPNLWTQSNTGGNPDVINPRGANALAAASAGFLGAVSDVVIANTFADRLDLIFDGPKAAVGGDVLDFLGAGTGVLIRVYDTSNVFLGERLVLADPAGTHFTGVLSARPIGRLNLFSTGNGAEGMDNIQAWACDPCDMNCDGLVNANDIEPFIDILFGNGQRCNFCTGDVNGDGVVDALDIEGFIDCLFP